jgi:hypothetical protein
MAVAQNRGHVRFRVDWMGLIGKTDWDFMRRKLGFGYWFPNWEF